MLRPLAAASCRGREGGRDPAGQRECCSGADAQPPGAGFLQTGRCKGSRVGPRTVLALAVHRGSALLQRTTFVLGGCVVLKISWHQGNGLLHCGQIALHPQPITSPKLPTRPHPCSHPTTLPPSHPPRAHPRTSRAAPYWQANCRSAKREEQSAGRGRLVWNRNSPATMRLDPARPARGGGSGGVLGTV